MVPCMQLPVQLIKLQVYVTGVCYEHTMLISRKWPSLADLKQKKLPQALKKLVAMHFFNILMQLMK
jgi:hypothetical protein